MLVLKLSSMNAVYWWTIHFLDPTIKNMAEKLIVQLAVEQLADRERSCEEEVQKEKSSESDDGLPGMIVFSCFL